VIPAVTAGEMTESLVDTEGFLYTSAVISEMIGVSLSQPSGSPARTVEVQQVQQRGDLSPPVTGDAGLRTPREGSEVESIAFLLLLSLLACAAMRRLAVKEGS
jgi:hypothetical protein